jgi:hypothetical protein
MKPYREAGDITRALAGRRHAKSGRYRGQSKKEGRRVQVRRGCHARLRRKTSEGSYADRHASRYVVWLGWSREAANVSL